MVGKNYDSTKKFLLTALFAFFLAVFLGLYFPQVTSAVTFTPGMAKRNAPGPFSVAPIFQGDPNNADTLTDDVVSFAQGTQISGNFYTNMDTSQGSIVLWWTPEFSYNSLSGSGHHYLYYINSTNYLRYEYDNDRFNLVVGNQSMTVSSNIASGTTYNIVTRWDIRNALSGANYAIFSLDDVHTAGVTTAPTASAPAATINVGSDGTTGAASGVIEGLTVYRRPLYDGTNGINAGNGDEINLIYNSGSGTDPASITGSWDVVFSLPTNQSVGTLATGTGEAWSHPHASNLLYTSTTNTGGFMLNGTMADDGWGLLPSNVPLSTDGDSLDFDGTADFLKASPNLSNTNKITIEFWMKWDNWANDDDLAMEYSTNANDHTDAFFIDPNESVSEEFSFFLQCAAGLNSSEFVRPTDNGWHHYAFVVDRSAAGASIITPYLDGTAVSYTKRFSEACTGNFGNYDLYFMSRAGASLISAGTMDDVRIWNTTRTGTQILTNKDKELAGNESGLVAYWKMNEGTGQTTADSTSNGYTATLGADTNAGADDPTWSTVSPLPPSALAASQKIYSGGYKYVSDAANQGIYKDLTVSAGDDWVVRGVANSDGTCIPKLILYDQTNSAEIGSLTGTTASTRTAPNVFIFTGEAPALETTLRVKLTSTAATGTCYWHQVEVLANLITNPSLENGAGVDWTPTGWSAGGSGGARTQDLAVKHSGASSIHFDHSTAEDPIADLIHPDMNTFTSGYFSSGKWALAETGSDSPSGGLAEDNAYLQVDGTQYYENHTTNTSWTFMPLIYRFSAGDVRYFLRAEQWTTTLGNADDIYNFHLNDVSLTVTPASETNSTENTDEIRVDGRDTYVESSQSTISTTAGFVSFNWRPRHAAADSVKFSETTDNDAYIISLNGDANDYIRAYWDSANTVRLSYNMNGTTDTSTWDATGAVAADTEYAASISYTGGGTMVLSIGGTARITLSSIPAAFGAAPDDIYFGSDTSGANQGDATYSSITFDSTAPSISFTALSPDPTTDTTPTLSGTATEAIGTVSTVQFQMDSTSGSWSSCTADDGTFDEANEAFSCTPGTALTDGSHTMYVRATDSNGNTTGSGSEASDTFTVDATSPGALSLLSPDNDSYSNSDRPTFTWRAPTDTTSSIDHYKLEIDNGSSGDFTIDSIPASRTTDLETDKYVIHYANFSDGDASNNALSLRTKSSNQWTSSENDGKLKEGRISWKVTGTDTAGNTVSATRTLFVDTTTPNLTFSSFNNTTKQFINYLNSNNESTWLTNETKLNLTGTVLDLLSGMEASRMVASGPKSITVTLEKQLPIIGSLTNLYSTLESTTIEFSTLYWQNSNTKITDFNSNIEGKYANFQYQNHVELQLGNTYRLRFEVLDRAGNREISKTIFINALTSAQVAQIPELPVPASSPLPAPQYPPAQPGASAFPLPFFSPEAKAPQTPLFTIPKISISFQPTIAWIRQFIINLCQSVAYIARVLFNFTFKIADLAIAPQRQALIELSRLRFVPGAIRSFIAYQLIKWDAVREVVFDEKPTTISDVKINNIDPNTVIITWKTNHLTKNNKVNFGENLSYGLEGFDLKLSREHEVKLTDLKPDTKYYFEVMSQQRNYVYDAYREFTTLKE